MPGLPFDLILRPAFGGDAAGIVALHRASVMGLAVGFYASDVLDAWSPEAACPRRIDELAARLCKGIEVGVVAAVPGGSLAGFASIMPSLHVLAAVYVHPDRIRCGVGRALVAAIERQALKAGVDELRMDASLNAADFYRALGYIETGLGIHVLSGGGEMACVGMRKRLPLPADAA